MSDTVLKWVECPACLRNWLHGSEQAVAVDRHGCCFGCIMVRLSAEARAREQAAGIKAVQCPVCVMSGDFMCPTCHGSRVAIERIDTGELIKYERPA